jgi:hypothetical protein
LREIGLRVSNYLIFIIFLCLLAAMQSSLWFHIFGTSPAPYFWLLVVCYWTLYRSLTEGVIMTYIATLAMVSMSGIPLSMAFVVHLSVYGCIFLMRDRVLWSGINSYILACGIAALVLPVFVILWSFFLEERSAHEFYFFDWAIRAPLTALFSIPFYYLFTWFDKITQKEAPKDAEAGFI